MFPQLWKTSSWSLKIFLIILSLLLNIKLNISYLNCYWPSIWYTHFYIFIDILFCHNFYWSYVHRQRVLHLMYQFTKSSKTVLFFIFSIASFFIGYIFSTSLPSMYPLSAHEYYPYLFLYVLIYLSMLKYLPDNFNIQNISDSSLAMWLRVWGTEWKEMKGLTKKYIYT